MAAYFTRLSDSGYPDASLDLVQGTVVANRYRIARPLGRGGMGEVFAAENLRTGRQVAVKLLRQDSKQKSSAIARFRQEARAAGSINSDYVTQVLDVEEDPEHGVVLVFELLEGESLVDRLKRTGPIRFEELWVIIEQVWLGLADAHRAGIIHRDLKPSNVFLERRPDGTTRVKILDFGISKVPKEAGGETLTEMGQSLGTFSFMPPEQIGKAKTVDHRADIYACATLIYQSLTAQLPYTARNVLVMVELKGKTDARSLAAASGGTFDPRLEAFVARGLARDPARRFQTAADALAAWRELRPGTGATEAQRAVQAQGASLPDGSSTPAPSASEGRRVTARYPSSDGRFAAPVAILEKPVDLPRVNADADPTTDEGVATLTMKRKDPPSGAPTGPHGTGLVDVRRAAGAGGQPPSSAPPPVVAPVVASSSSRAVAPPGARALVLGKGGVAGAIATPTAPGELPRTYSDQDSANETQTHLYQPKAARQPSPASPTAPASPASPASPAHVTPAPSARRPLRLVLVLVGFLVVGFVAVASVMLLLGR